MNEDLNSSPKPAKLYVVGAGPGDPELITLKAYRILKHADVILYDNLANQELLSYAPDRCEKIYVGKMPYGAYTPQETIHELIRQKALEKGTVVRLKGGDPYIFGRGFEEVLYAREHGIEASYVPGITSMQAAGLEDIPLTHRNVCESIWVVTGTKKDGSLSDDLALAIKSKATVVIYMGMKKLKEISETFVQQGCGELPAAIIQHASLPKQKMVRGRVQDLQQMAADHHLTHPSIIIIGRVAGIDPGK
ncbi:uroporphyrinogen-III C-methyltransferase [Paraflavisolibacter sp. H34]|uniref:uroporphyrinogen-III C-methyltransferase n=1 Tax=Huijunlia imazamoxiresistens TaxID=3127457 RepID=UPI00301ABA29